MKYFFAKIDFVQMPDEIRRLNDFHPKRMQWKADHRAEKKLMVENPLGLDLPPLNKLPLHKNWETLRLLGWFADEKLTEFGYFKWKLPETDEETLHCMMGQYDWYNEMSDGASVIAAGRAYDRCLRALVANSKSLSIPEATAIFNSYAPTDRQISESWWNS